MMFRISPRRKQYLETVGSLLRAAKTMIDQAIASQLKALADDYRRRVEEVSKLMRQKDRLVRLPALKVVAQMITTGCYVATGISEFECG